MSTINDLSTVSSVSSADKLPVWSNANGVTRGLPLSVLDARYVTQDQIALLAISPTPEIFSAGDGIAPNTFLPGTTSVLVLQNQYYSAANIEVFFDGTFQGPDQYSLIGFSLAFTSVIPVGIQKVYIRGGASRLTNAPTVGTVTDQSIASGTKLSNRINDIFDVKDYGAKGDGVTDDTSAIQAADNAVFALGGGVLNFPRGVYCHTGLTKQNSHVVWKGAGGDTYHDGGTGSGPATMLKYIGAANGVCLSISTPQNNVTAIKVGMGVTDMGIDGSETAAYGILIQSIRQSTFENLFVTGVSLCAYFISTYARSTMAEASDTQGCVFSRCTWRLLSTFSNVAVGMWLTAAGGNGTANANTSFNTFILCSGQNGASSAFLLADCDNNTFIGCCALRTNLTVPGLDIQGGDNNYFYGFSSGGSLGIRIQGTAAGLFHTPIANTFYSMDTGNGTAFPTLGAGCIIHGPMWEYTLLVSTATAGGAGAPPAQVSGYIDVFLPNGQKAKIPYYNE